ncbi:MAG: heavy-metal-associated domain-containing protein [Candidatus Thiodiazotropha sp.]|jgi:copper chaperone
MTLSLYIDNIKCGGCANTIRKRLQELDGVTGVTVTVEEGLVEVEADEGLRPQLIATLEHAGYPERGSVEGLASVKAKAVSFVSCAIGRMDKGE